MKKVFFLIVMAIMVVGCQDEEIVVSDVTTNNKTETIRDDILMRYFNSFDELNYFVEKNEGSDLLDLAKQESKEGNYNPLLLVYAEFSEEGKEIVDVPVVNTQSGLLLLLLNEAGEIGVKNHIFRIDGEFVYSFSVDMDADARSQRAAEFLEKYAAGSFKLPEGDSMEYDDITVYHHDNKETTKSKTTSARTFNSTTTSINGNTSLRGIGADEYWFFISFVWFSTNVEYDSALPGVVNMLFNATKSDNRLNYDVGIQTSNVSFPFTSATSYYGIDVHETSRILWRLPKFSFGFPAPERYTITLGGSLHDTYWGTSPTGSFYSVFNAY